MNVTLCDRCGQRLGRDDDHLGFEVNKLGPFTNLDPGLYHYCSWTCMAADADANSDGGTR